LGDVLIWGSMSSAFRYFGCYGYGYGYGYFGGRGAAELGLITQ
jgi:hypothetical protein